MKRRDIGILVGLGIVVLLVAWYFLIIGPKRDEVADVDGQLKTERESFETNRERIRRIGEERQAASLATGELLKLYKLVPADEQVPSLIVELQQSANEAGIEFMKIEPTDAFPGPNGNTVIPFDMEFQGNFFDVNDFLFRIENFARLEGNDINVSGRLVSVVTIEISEASVEAGFPDVLVKLGLNAFMTGSPQAAVAGPATPPADTGETGNGEGEANRAAAP
ncbi:MAG: type 4a pilus biogenesis protein PilO [Thermoleophilia bacterium]|nr:type 4a pilus biogenesis protein PilO [Thermoleophilia bacterium]